MKRTLTAVVLMCLTVLGTGWAKVHIVTGASPDSYVPLDAGAVENIKSSLSFEQQQALIDKAMESAHKVKAKVVASKIKQPKTPPNVTTLFLTLENDAPPQRLALDIKMTPKNKIIHREVGITGPVDGAIREYLINFKSDQARTLSYRLKVMVGKKNIIVNCDNNSLFPFTDAGKGWVTTTIPATTAPDPGNANLLSMWIDAEADHRGVPQSEYFCQNQFYLAPNIPKRLIPKRGDLEQQGS